MFGLVVLVAAAAPAADPDPQHLAVPPAEQARAKDLVEKLASPAYPDREQAQADLAALGRKAVPALADALARHPSPEVRARCQALYPRARADDLQARLLTFAADTAGKFEHDLPGWADFRAATINCGPAARGVFADLVASPLGRELVLGELPPAELGARVAARKQELYNRRYATARRAGEALPEPPATDILAVMWAEARVPSRHVPRSATATAVYVIPGFAAALAAGTDRGKVFRALAGKWVSTRDEALVMTQGLPVGMALDLPECGGLGARMLTTPGVTAASKSQAVAAVGKVGDPRHLPALEAVFKDESPARQTGVVIAAPVPIGGPAVAPVPAGAQLRDVALAAAATLTGQPPADYGFVEVGGRRDAQVWELAPARRAAAFEKWAAWRAANPDFGKP